MKRSNGMPILLVILLTGLAVAGTESTVIRLSEPVATEANAEVFGARMDESLPLKRLGELVSDPDDWLGRQVRVEARVSKVCQKKGCFFIAKDGETTLRVAFLDYGFFVPTDIGGRTVTLAGELIRTERTAAEADHLSSDLGETVASGAAFEILASSVRVPFD